MVLFYSYHCHSRKCVWKCRAERTDNITKRKQNRVHIFWYIRTLSARVNTGIPVVHDDVIKWKTFPCYWPFVRGIHWPGEFPAQRPVTRSFDVFFYQICVWINGRENNREAGDLRRHHAHYDVIVMRSSHCKLSHEYFYRYIGVSNACCLVHILKCILLNHRLYQYFIEVCSQRCNLI